jgi:hypothetical protein
MADMAQARYAGDQCDRLLGSNLQQAVRRSATAGMAYMESPNKKVPAIFEKRQAIEPWRASFDDLKRRRPNHPLVWLAQSRQCRAAKTAKPLT